MRHGKKGFKLGRTHAHRKATLAALSSALIKHKRITTTFTKAKALRMYVEPLITRAKEDTTPNRRQVFRHLQNKHAVTELFGEIAELVGDRPGGYTRVIKLGQRAGDGAEMAMIELVDYNDVKPEGGSTSRKRRTRRSGGRRRSKTAQTATQAAAATEAVEAATEELPVEEAQVDEAVAAAEGAVAEAPAEAPAPEEAVAEAPAEEAPAEEAPAEEAAAEEAPKG